MLHEAIRLGIMASGIDISGNALLFAQYLSHKFGSQNFTLVHGDALSKWSPPLLPADLVSNVGSFEHLCFNDQLVFARFMESLSKK